MEEKQFEYTKEMFEQDKRIIQYQINKHLHASLKEYKEDIISKALYNAFIMRKRVFMNEFELKEGINIETIIFKIAHFEILKVYKQEKRKYSKFEKYNISVVPLTYEDKEKNKSEDMQEFLKVFDNIEETIDLKILLKDIDFVLGTIRNKNTKAILSKVFENLLIGGKNRNYKNNRSKNKDILSITAREMNCTKEWTRQVLNNFRKKFIYYIATGKTDFKYIPKSFDYKSYNLSIYYENACKVTKNKF